MPKEFHSLISLDLARSMVLERLPTIHIEEVALDRAGGRILAESMVSEIDVPGFARASMDGFAVLSEETIEAREDRPVLLRLAGSVPMGRRPVVSVGFGEAVEVSTGSMMPQGADAVVMIEYSEAQGEEVSVRRPVFRGENIQAAGSDISFGETVLFSGTRLQPRDIGVLAAIGRASVPVRSLRVAISSTGDEIVMPGEPLTEGRIYDINSHTIASAVEECGGTACFYGILPDEKEAMAGALQRMALECDLILVSGSTSAGAADMIYQVMEELGGLIFHGVNLKPGKPTIFGTIDGKPCLGLPGYPTSALTVFSLLAAPLIRAALGVRATGQRAFGRLASPVRSEGRRQMLAVGLSGELVYPLDKGSGSITTLALADGVIDIPEGVEYLDRGASVSVELFGDAPTGQLVIAGESSTLIEEMATSLFGSLRLLSSGAHRAISYLEDGVADIACIIGPVPSAFERIGVIMLEMGLAFRDSLVTDDLFRYRIVNWSRDSAHHSEFGARLLELGMQKPEYVRLARSSRSIAAAVATGRADLGYAERRAAEEAGLGFLPMGRVELQLLAKNGSGEDPKFRPLFQALSRERGA